MCAWCFGLGAAAIVGQAARRANGEAHNGNSIRYVIPREGAMLYFDPVRHSSR